MTGPRTFVVATAGHVDHGKSTLVRALTGIEPDRWAEEKRRGLTIDLGFAWTRLPSEAEVAFVDVPGHERFLGNMLAGLGPTPVVCFVIAADEGWQAQSSDHRDAVAALGVTHGLVVITKADRAPDRIDSVVAQARAELAGTALANAPAVITSAASGTGLDDLRAALDAHLAELPAADRDARVRFWVDRSFSIKGSGTVVTGTLATGTISAEDTLDLSGDGGLTTVTVRGLQRQGLAITAATPTTRLAINLRGLRADQVRRGDVLLSQGRWMTTDLVDTGRVSGAPLDEAPEHLVAHVGTAAVPARLRPLDADHGRLRLDRPLPLVRGDRLVLRDPSSRRVLGGVVVLDAEPPPLTRRGDASRRATALGDADEGPDVAAEVGRRGAVRRAHLVTLGLLAADSTTPPSVTEIGDWWVHDDQLDTWARRLDRAVTHDAATDPLSPGLTLSAAATAAGLPDRALLPTLAARAGLSSTRTHVRRPAPDDSLGPAESGVHALEQRLRTDPFDVPEADDLAALGLASRELAAAERVGRLLRLAEGIVVLPSAPALAMRTLSALPQPFTTSAARQALGMTRRTVIPLLEHLDRRGWTRRLDAGHREVTRPARPGS